MKKFNLNTKEEVKEAKKLFNFKSATAVFDNSFWLLIRNPLTRKIILRKYENCSSLEDIILNKLEINNHYTELIFNDFISFKYEYLEDAKATIKYFEKYYSVANFDIQQMRKEDKVKNKTISRGQIDLNAFNLKRRKIS